MEHSRETRHLLNNHMQVTEIKLDNLDKAGEARHTTVVEKVERLESGIKWAGGLIISLVLTVLGWALLQQINANETQKKELAQQVKLLQDQERARVNVRAEILSRLPSPARAAETERTSDAIPE